MASTLFIPGTVVRSIWLNEVDKATHNALTAVAGTNTITATGPLTEVSYVTGDRFFFVPAITNTGATTININGLGAKNLTKYGVSALVAGDLVAGTAAEIYYDGVQFQLLNPQKVNVANSTGILPVANGGTGDAGTAWNSTTGGGVSASSGTISSATTATQWKIIGKTVFFRGAVTVSNNGTGAGTLLAAGFLPVAPIQTLELTGREAGVSGKVIAMQASPSSTSVTFFNYDNTYPGATGAVLIVSGVYESV